MFRIIMFMSGSIIGTVPLTQKPKHGRLYSPQGIVVANRISEFWMVDSQVPLSFPLRKYHLPLIHPVTDVVQGFDYFLSGS